VGNGATLTGILSFTAGDMVRIYNSHGTVQAKSLTVLRIA
jgi:hypothetical protein